MAAPVMLSLAAVDILSATFEYNVRQFPFQIPYVGQYDEDRLRIAEVVFQNLRDRGLIRDNALDDTMAKALALTTTCQVAVAMMGTVETDRSIFARASATGEQGVLAVKEGESLRFELVNGLSLARALVALLPPLPSGPGQSVTVMSAATPRDEDGGYVERVRPLPTHGTAQTRAVQAIMERTRTGAGYFSVEARGRHGRVVDGGQLGWLDTDAGRYLTLTRTNAEGQTSTTFSPADNGRLTAQLHDLVLAVSPQR